MSKIIRIVGPALGLAIAAATIGVAVTPAERGALRTEQTDTRKIECKVDRLRRKLRDPLRTATKEMARRVRQVALGQLRADNGLTVG